MNLFDLIIVALAIAAAIGGYRLGFLARALSWVGLGVGLYVGARLVPPVLLHLNPASAGGRLLIAALVLVGAAFAGQVLGLVIGSRAHRVLPLGPLRQLDRVVGAGVGVVGVVVALWLLLPAIASVPGVPARAARNSAVSRWVSAHLAQPPNTLESLRRLVGQNTFPQVFGSLQQGGSTGPPPGINPLSATVTATVAASTVKVEGQACNQIQDGSGFAVARDLVVTNAHVVAGEPNGQTAVILPSGRRRPATVVAFDPNRDLALLSVPALGEQPLTLVVGKQGQSGAVFGHPGGQAPLAITPAQVSQEVTAVGRDLYDRHQTKRDVFILAAALAQGDSGGALVNTAGAVIGVAFAIAPDAPGTSYALSTTEVQAVLPTRSAAAATGDCLIGG
ncbi:MAG: MarP family serine protease [Actinomycetota bacterium]|nr:MarP family serine protease [Actinomycetota bacterium]